MSRVEVNTGDAELGDPGVVTAMADEKEIVVDTTADVDELDAVIEQTPIKQEPDLVTDPEDSRGEAAPKKHKKKRSVSHEEKKKKHKKPAPSNPLWGAIDENPDFARAMRKTVPRPDPEDVDLPSEDGGDTEEEEEEEEDSRPRKGGKKDVSESEGEEEDLQSAEAEEEDEDSDKRGADEDLGSEASSVIEDPKDEEAAKEDEYVEKMQVIEEIKGYARLGIVPPQPPAFSMPLSLLKKIRDYMSDQADMVMGIGMLGTGWCQVVGLIEKITGHYNGFKGILGTGLKLNGARAAVEGNLHLYEAVFKHIYKKMPKNKEMNPWIQFCLITVQILGQVHISNVQKEMEEEAARMMRDPHTREDAEHMRRMYEERERYRAEQQRAQQQQQQQQQPASPQAQPTMKPVTEVDLEAEEGEGEAEIELKHPPPPEEEPISEKRSEEDKVSESESEDDDDDIIVEIPKAGSRKKKDDL